MLQKLTVKHLDDLISRALAVIEHGEGADEHYELLHDLTELEKLTSHCLATSHMGCAADVVILEDGDAPLYRAGITVPPDWLPSPSLTKLFALPLTVMGELLTRPPCTHNRMVERPDNPAHAWECADCGYIYDDSTRPDWTASPSLTALIDSVVPPSAAPLPIAALSASRVAPNAHSDVGTYSAGALLDYAALCRDVAAALQGDGFPAFSQMMGGGTFCVIVHETTRLDAMWIFGTANDTWSGDLCFVENGELIGETSGDTQHIVTDIPSTSTDPHAIAIDGIVQGLLAWRNAR